MSKKMLSLYSDIEREEMVRVYYCEANANSQQTVEIYKKSSFAKLLKLGTKYLKIPTEREVQKVVADFDNRAGPSTSFREMREGRKNTSYRSRLEEKVLKYFQDNPTSSSKKAAHHFGISSTVISKILQKRPDYIRKSDASQVLHLSQNNAQKLTSEPILLVYTTRLDDMTVLLESKHNFISNESLLKEIEAASRPTFDLKAVSRKRRYPAYKEYYSIKNKLHTLKECIQKKNQQLHSPPAVVLTKNDNSQIGNNLKDLNYNNNEQTSDDVVEVREDNAIVSLSDSDDEPIVTVKKKLVQIQQNTFSEQSNLNHTINSLEEKNWPYVLISRSKGHHSMVFSYNHNRQPTILVNYFYATELSELGSILRREPRLVIDICCWYKLDHVLKQMKFVNLPSYYHQCHHQSCECCCRKKAANNEQNAISDDLIRDDSENGIDRVSTIEEYSHLNIVENSFLKNVLKTLKPSKIIRNALAFQMTVNITPTKRNKTTPNNCGDKKSLYFMHKKKTIEYYTLNTKGNLVGYCHNATEKFYGFTVSIIRTKMVHNICCWNRFSNIIANFIVNSCSPKTLKFIYRFHTCPVGRCQCCCKQQVKKKMKVNMTLNDTIEAEHMILNRSIMISPQAIETISTRIDNVHQQMTSDLVCDLKPSIESNNVAISTYTDNASEQMGPAPICGLIEPTIESNTVAKSTKTMRPNILKQQSKNSNSPAVLIPIAKTTSTRKSSYDHPVHPSILPVTIITPVFNPDGTIPTFTGNISAHVLSAIAEVPEAQPHKDAICEMYQNLVIYLDAFGKVTTALPKPVTLLSPVEIKVLSKLLSKAEATVYKTNAPSDSSAPNFNLTLSKMKHKEKLFQQCSQTSAIKSRAFKSCLYNRRNPIDENILQHVESISNSNTPRIENVFSCTQNLNFNEHIRSDEFIPGPSDSNLYKQPVVAPQDVVNNPSTSTTPFLKSRLPIGNYNHLIAAPIAAPTILNSTNIANPTQLNNNTHLFVPTLARDCGSANKNAILKNLLESNVSSLGNTLSSSNVETSVQAKIEPTPYVIEMDEEEEEEVDIKEEIEIEEECILGA